MGKPTSIRIDAALRENLDALAAITDRPRAWHIAQAIRRYVTEEAWQVRAIHGAKEDYQRGTAELAPHDGVMQRLEARVRAAQQ